MKIKLLMALCLFSISNASAITLKDGLVVVFNETPSLQNAKKQLNIRDEQISQAFAAFLPSISASYSIAHKNTRIESNPTKSVEEKPTIGSISLNQNIFKGGSVFARYNKAKLIKLFEIANFKQSQQNLFLDASNKYLTILTSEEVFELSKRQVATNAEEMKRLKQRFDLGDVTLPNLKEFEARLAGYMADKEEAYGDVLAANSNFSAIFGKEPKNLIWPKLISQAPTSVDEAIKISEK